MNKHQLTHKQYLGDGVYVGYDGYHVWLYTDTGIAVTNQIALEPPVLRNLAEWQNNLTRKENETC